MHCQLPVTLVLGMTTSPSALERLLPLEAVAALRLRPFYLAPARARAEAVFSEAKP